ncbi:MAG: hypothetical protein F4X82_02270 [Candidatus Spechtbacteria bacterium SB0662_bin_43]|uniref:Uncharacterized protein n=1 Tax=Candidatus Spechtbacteria bacterium SB0662_bin_43 TaxID=2604897 RepID=A0A845DA04_9BACT|nr:hypothetical protein [Candidatus Spechtbacteria bacterium SB0662_bin_43]
MPEGEDSCYFAVCEEQNSYLCAQDILDAVVFLAGPEEATGILEDIMASTLFAIQTDGHQLSHVIGRATSHHFGLSGKSFLRCPADFNYGCQHGFFEDALIQHATPVKAATEICEHIPDRPYKNKFYCYHGVGHGFMFHESYHLKNALDLCDALPSFTAQEGCYQGVFMENVNGFFSDAEGEKGFTDNDTLAPCNRIKDTYRHQCYENHASYILFHHNNSIRDASHACLGAGDYISSCINSLGLMVTNPGWQQTLRGSFNGTFTEIAAHLCNQFPADHIETCQLAAISNLSNFDTTDIRRQVELCLFFEGNTDRCFETIGTLLINVAASQDEVMKSCEAAPEEFRDECYYPNLNQQQQNATNEQDKTTTGLSSFQLPYPLLIVGCAIPAIFLIYYFYRSKKKRERFINKQITQ